MRKYHQELVSEEVQQIISCKPHWVIRKGNGIFLLVLVGLVILTWFVRYPEVLKGSLTLSAINPPKLVTTKTDGKLQKLLVKNEQEVFDGQILAYMQSTAKQEQVLDLKNRINVIESSVAKDNFDVLLSSPFPTYDQLGELQSQYQDFQTTLKETLQVLANGYYKNKKEAINKELDYLSSIQLNTQQQQLLSKQDYDLQLKEYQANESLAKDKIISPLELNQNKSKLIGKKQNIELISAQLINNYISQHNKRTELLELQKYVIDQHQKFKSQLFILKNKIEEWTFRYVITAPEKGKVLFVSFLQENKMFANGQAIFYIEPSQSSYYGQMMAAQSGLGKIKFGQKVLIKVESYPSNEFGYLIGTVDYISAIPTAKDSFLIKVVLPNKLRTNYNKELAFRNNLIATAQIITENKRLLDRMFFQIRKLEQR